MRENTRRPLPRFPEALTEPFWELTRAHRLGYQVCQRCQGLVFYPRRHCTHCTSTALEWRDSSGKGYIYTFTVMRQHAYPVFQAMIPYVLALVDLDEGFRMLTQIVDVDPAAVRVGQRVQVRWLDQDTVALPIFGLCTGEQD